MPGHKRRALPFPNPYTIDITEIDGFDNLHHAEGLIREAEERAAKLYGADRSYYLVNGSTCGLLAAICAAARRGDKVLAARNCHKAVYHAISMQGLAAEFLYPAITRGDLQGQITAAQVEEALTKHPDIAVVILTAAVGLGASPFVMQSTESLLTIAFNVSLQRYGGDAAVGAMTILTSVAQMVQLPLTGLAQGAQPILSYACGAKRPDRMKHVVQLNLAAAFVFAFSIWAAVQLFPHTVVHLFTSDEELVERTIWALRVYFALGFTNAFQTGFQQSFVALGEARISLFLALERKVFLLIPFILILPHFFADKLFAVFLAEPVADLLAAATTTTLFLIRFKQITRDM